MKTKLPLVLNYKKMLEDICLLVENDFFFDMDTRNVPNPKPFTQEEAKQMCKIIGEVYSIAHGIHCVYGNKYRINVVRRKI